MSVRVVARIRPLLKAEMQRDIIVDAANTAGDAKDAKTIVRIPNPKKESEAFSFQFNSVYDSEATQAQLFDAEGAKKSGLNKAVRWTNMPATVSPTVKHLFKGYDVTIFAYGVTGTGKTHTMRGGKSLADRGVIPRMLSGIYRKARKIEKDSEGNKQVQVSMSYYEIYNDKVFDLFEPPEKRTPAGLPIRDIGNGKTQVVGLTERPCTTLKEFEQLYDKANVNRSTSATKLNAHSSRSHAVLCVKVTQTDSGETRVSTASAIDLAGSEDNRRTENNKDRMVESASINKSLFVLAQCVEAISKKQSRIPYRESKMTRILSLGQNDGFTVMILNLAPVRSYHLDTLSSLNFANRTKKIEVNEVENQPFFRDQPGKSKLDGATNTMKAAPLHRQPLKSKILSQSSHLQDVTNVPKPTKAFAVFTDKPKTSQASHAANTSQVRALGLPIRSPPKRTSSDFTLGRPSKFHKSNDCGRVGTTDLAMTKDAIEALIERKVSEALAERADQTKVCIGEPISDDMQRRLDALERRVEGKESERAEGLQYLLMAKQHQVRGEDASALKMYQLALPHFPGNEKLARKLVVLQDRIAAKDAAQQATPVKVKTISRAKSFDEDAAAMLAAKRKLKFDADESYHDDHEDPEDMREDGDFVYRPRTKIRRPHNARLEPIGKVGPSRPVSEPAAQMTSVEEARADSDDELAIELSAETPRTKHLLNIINTKDVSKIKLLKGVGPKRAEAIVNCLCDLDDDTRVTSLGQLGKLKGVGLKTVESMRCGVVV
ncbi:Hypothetical protein R9X50_00333900 [Acrodontium crateriforme]|uniref:Kinesin motor domain-containing protein n=1 Tax=Acrodontium crateriforme TaxID=150365 RepID=A0AAQ3R9T9_9PEZI|nr:Hypothetical protein R9X50_00333900 [Acrodontium crateriforme]